MEVEEPSTGWIIFINDRPRALDLLYRRPKEDGEQ